MPQIRHSRGTRVTLLTIAIAWLQMALLPCVMAGTVDVNTEAAKHLLETEQVQADGQVDAQLMPHGERDCPYCPPDNDPCETMNSPADVPADCAFPHGAQDDRAGVQLAHSALVHAITVDTWPASLLLRESPAFPPPRPAPFVPRPHRLTHCIQLR